MPNGPVTARVFVWYPHASEDHEHIGHVSMYIGNYEVGRKFELSLDHNSPEYVFPNATEASSGLRGRSFNDNYVSWWPEGGGGIRERGAAEPKLGLYGDVAAERSPPHVVYDLYKLNVGKMRSTWHATRDKPNASYQFLRKNCAGIVMRVLRAGGVTQLMGARAVWFGSRAVWTPKHVAQVCNQLRDRDYAEKDKAGNCPPKDEKVYALLGLR